MTPRYLQEILEARGSRLRPPRPAACPPPRDFRTALAARPIAIVAEIKIASPSKGVLLGDRDPAQLARTYAEHGAAAISVVTEETRFLGSMDLLRVVRDATDRPVLRKDFLTSDDDVDESVAWGASAILLIARILDGEALDRLVARAESRGIAAVVEVHDEDDVCKARRAGARLYGVNNRNLESFEVSLSVSEELGPLLPAHSVRIAESGIGGPEDIRRLHRAGFTSFLVGESLISSPDPGALLDRLAGALACA
ncbi:MAG: indole-3-glycerol phosphate synthase TrpC [Acidobacteriota bacterium]